MESDYMKEAQRMVAAYGNACIKGRSLNAMDAAADALLSHIAKGEQAPAAHPSKGGEVGWQPIETAPKDGTSMVVWVPWKSAYAFGCYRAKKYGKVAALGWSLSFMNGYKLHGELEPSHWMPLPADPGATPSTPPTAPEIDRGDDGELLIDWSPDKGRMLSMILLNGRLSYAFTWDGEKAHGTVQMPPPTAPALSAAPDGPGCLSRDGKPNHCVLWTCHEAKTCARQGDGAVGVAMGDCGNAECNWRGPLSACSYLGAVGPCCPECREIVEPDAPGVAAVPAAGPLRDLGAYLARVLDEDQWAHAEALLLKAALSAAPDGEARDAARLGFVKPDTDKQVFFYEQDFYVLSNFSAFTLMWRGFRFDTSEAAYHYEKFDYDDDPLVYPIAQDIRHAPSAHEAFKMAERNKAYRRPDWDRVKVDIMRNILRAKVDQHEYVRRKLLATGDRELIEDSWRDDFWGWGPNRDGKNMLGKLWMEVRSELRAAMAGGSK